MTTEMARFGPQHVTPDLARLAVRYVEQYKGDFPYLVDIRNRIALVGEKSLTRYMVKGVLNCMLHDPNVLNLPRPETVAFDAEEEIEEVHVTRRRRRVRVHDPNDPFGGLGDSWERNQIDEEWGEPEPEKPPLNPYRRLQLRSSWNYDYGVSSAKLACRVHIVDHTVPVVSWYPGGANPDGRGHIQPYILLQLKWLCKPPHSMGRSPNYELMSYDQAVYVACLAGWDWCAACQRVNEERNVLADRKSR